MKVRQLYDVGSTAPRPTSPTSGAVHGATAAPSPLPPRRRRLDQLALSSQLLSLRRLLTD